MIGWEQIFLGRFQRKWIDLIDNHTRTLPKKQRKILVSGQTRMKGMTEILYHFAWNVWQERNRDRHIGDKIE